MKFYILGENKRKFIGMCKNILTRIKSSYYYVYIIIYDIFFIQFSYTQQFFLVYIYVK